MRQIEDARRRHEEIPILTGLFGWVKTAIVRSEGRRKSQRQRIPAVRTRRRHRMWGTCAGMAAALVLVFITALNTSTASAEVAAGLPVIGAAARIFIFRFYERDEGDQKISVETLSVEMIVKDTNGLDSVSNQETYGLCSQYVDEAAERAKEYKKAFMETGGVEEEREAHGINIHMGYEIRAQTEAYLSFVVQGIGNQPSAYSETRYYNIDLKGNKMATLADVLGHDCAGIADESILHQIENMEEKEDTVFWSKSEGGLIGVTGKTVFYMNKKGNSVIVFDKCEIAPGACGKLELRIDKTGNTVEKTGYTDNFMVPEEEITAFAGEVKEAVADRDMDALASLTSYPLRVRSEDGGVSTRSPEELAVLGVDRIFTPELATAVEVTGDKTFSPSMAGLVLKKDGTPNIVFGVSEGMLAVKGINYRWSYLYQSYLVCNYSAGIRCRRTRP